MLALKILGVLAVLIFLICCITVGVDVNYVGGKLTLSAKLCGILLQIYPRKKRTKKEEKPKKEEKEPKPEKEKPEKPKKTKKKKKEPGLMISGDELIDLLKKLLEGLGKFSKGINVDRFLLHYFAAGDDPYVTARVFAFVNAMLSTLAPVCAERFRCKKCDVWTGIDFTEPYMKLDFGIAVVLRVGAVFAMLFTILFGLIGILIRNRVHWFYLKHFDKEEYEFQISNPGIVTRLLRSLLEKDGSENAEDGTPDAEPNKEPVSDPETEKEETENTEEERMLSNGE